MCITGYRLETRSLPNDTVEWRTTVESPREALKSPASSSINRGSTINEVICGERPVCSAVQPSPSPLEPDCSNDKLLTNNAVCFQRKSIKLRCTRQSFLISSPSIISLKWECCPFIWNVSCQCAVASTKSPVINHGRATTFSYTKTTYPN